MMWLSLLLLMVMLRDVVVTYRNVVMAIVGFWKDVFFVMDPNTLSGLNDCSLEDKTRLVI